jgi:hypothetical protein
MDLGLRRFKGATRRKGKTTAPIKSTKIHIPSTKIAPMKKMGDSARAILKGEFGKKNRAPSSPVRTP